MSKITRQSHTQQPTVILAVQSNKHCLCTGRIVSGCAAVQALKRHTRPSQEEHTFSVLYTIETSIAVVGYGSAQWIKPVPIAVGSRRVCLTDQSRASQVSQLVEQDIGMIGEILTTNSQVYSCGCHKKKQGVALVLCTVTNATNFVGF